MQLLVMGIGLFKSLLVVVHTPPPYTPPTSSTLSLLLPHITDPVTYLLKFPTS
jgi:hypothetical protein